MHPLVWLWWRDSVNAWRSLIERVSQPRGALAIPIQLSRPAWVDIGVFDAIGRRVRTLHAGVLPAGTSDVRWDARTDAGHAAPSGIYYVRMLAGGRMRSQRAVLVR